MTVTAAPLTAPHRHHSALTIGIAVVAFAGVPAIWLPFGSDVTPASALFEGGFLLLLWPLAWPYLLAIPIAAALVRWIASGRLSAAERWAGRLLAAGAAELAFLAMAHQRLGQRDAALAALEQLRAEVKQPDNGNNEELQGFLRESEAVVTGAGARPAAPEAART